LARLVAGVADGEDDPAHYVDFQAVPCQSPASHDDGAVIRMAYLLGNS